jgi:hypothetical protein
MKTQHRKCPRPKRTDDVLYAWAERIDMVRPPREEFQFSSMICEGDRLFHYGHHFELGRILRDKRGRARLVLLNGDSYQGSNGWGPSTASRQRDTRRVANMSSVPVLVVPFSALEGAGIDFDTIQPIAVRDDWWTTEERSSRTRPAKLATMKDPDGRTVPEMHWQRKTNRSYEFEQVEVQVPMYVPNPNQTVSFNAGHGWCGAGATRDEHGVWHWSYERHWLGDSLFRARSTELRTRRATRDELAQHDAHLAYMRERHRLEEVEQDMLRAARTVAGRELSRARTSTYDRYGWNGDYRRMTRSLFASAGFREKASAASQAVHEHRRDHLVEGVGMLPGGRMRRSVTRWATFLSSFDYQESQPLYFLCELPHNARPNTVDEAIESLKPPEVVAAEARGLKVTRQGDLFAIPTKLTRAQLRKMRSRTGFTKRLRVLGTNHSVTEGIILQGGAVLGRGVMRHEPEAWRRPDHRNQKIGDVWHLLVRNTVPRTR